jgi:hypothetical protein
MRFELLGVLGLGAKRAIGWGRYTKQVMHWELMFTLVLKQIEMVLRLSLVPCP